MGTPCKVSSWSTGSRTRLPSAPPFSGAQIVARDDGERNRQMVPKCPSFGRDSRERLVEHRRELGDDRIEREDLVDLAGQCRPRRERDVLELAALPDRE